jgi:ribose transport system ATP-binding protein
MKELKSRAVSLARSDQSRTTLILIGAILCSGVFFGVGFPGFLSSYNFTNIAVQTAVISLVAFPMTVVIIVRGVDLSVGSSLALAGVVGAMAFQASGGSSFVSLAAIILAAVAVGAFNGFLISVLHVNAFMATLGTMALARGAATALSGGNATPVQSPAILFLGRESLGGIPWSVIVTVIALIVFALLLQKTLLGRWLLAVGGNKDAAIANAIPARSVEFFAYVLIGLAVGIGAIITIGRTGSAQPLAGQNLEFSAITASIIGAASLAGGRGSAVSTFLGSVFVGLISSGLSFAGVDQSMIYVYTGVLTVLAVVVSQKEVTADLRGNVLYLANSARARASRRVRASMGGGNAAHTLEIAEISKSFGATRVLKDVSFDVRSGEVVALMGENGAGKSTLVKVIAGNHAPSGGKLLLDGRALELAGPEDARKAGIAVIHQHFSLVPDLTVAQNLFLGNELRAGRFGPLRRRLMVAETQKSLDELEMPFAATDRLSDLSVGHRQMVEIVRALREDAWLVIMDEPTSALSSRERDRLYELIERLTARNTAILYISHKMDEVFHLCSRAVVLRDGQLVGDENLDAVTSAGLVGLMVGKDVDSAFTHVPSNPGEVLVRVSNVGDGSRLIDASLEVRAGESVGLVGLMGSGRSELLRSIAGLNRVAHGTVEVLGADASHASLHALAKKGLAFVPEDRHSEGMFPQMSVAANISLLWLRGKTTCGWIKATLERPEVHKLMTRLGVRPSDPTVAIKNLSGGNQQKVVLGRWLALDPKIILLDDPTRGVDVGAKSEIHALINEFKIQGAAVVVTSSELPEVLGVTDRVVVMREGSTVAEFARGASEHEVMAAAFGDHKRSSTASSTDDIQKEVVR